MRGTGLFIFIPITLAIGVTWFHHRLCRNSLNAWAKSEHLTLLEVRFSWPFQGPDAWRRSRNQTQYRVKVWDARGQILQGWITLGIYWGFSWYKVSDVVWG